MNIPKGRFLSGTAIALTLSFLTSCASRNMNNNIEPEEKSPLVQAVEKATHAARDMPIAEEEGLLFMSPPISEQNHTENDISTIDKKNTTSPFSDAVETAVDKAKDTHDSDTENAFPFVQEHNDQPEEP